MKSRPSFETILESAKDSVKLATQLTAEIEAGADIDLCATLSRELFAKSQPLAMVFDTLAGVLLAKEQEKKAEESAVDNVVAMIAPTQPEPEEGSA